MIITEKEFLELAEAVQNTDLFDIHYRSDYARGFLLKGTTSIFFNITLLKVSWFQYRHGARTFNQIFELSSQQLQEQLIYHIDILQNKG